MYTVISAISAISCLCLTFTCLAIISRKHVPFFLRSLIQCIYSENVSYQPLHPNTPHPIHPLNLALILKKFFDSEKYLLLDVNLCVSLCLSLKIQRELQQLCVTTLSVIIAYTHSMVQLNVNSLMHKQFST